VILSFLGVVLSLHGVGLLLHNHTM
jgi:hypothetical protein